MINTLRPTAELWNLFLPPCLTITGPATSDRLVGLARSMNWDLYQHLEVEGL